MSIVVHLLFNNLTLNQWFLTFAKMQNPYVIFQAFVESHFCPI